MAETLSTEFTLRLLLSLAVEPILTFVFLLLFFSLCSTTFASEVRSLNRESVGTLAEISSAKVCFIKITSPSESSRVLLSIDSSFSSALVNSVVDTKLSTPTSLPALVPCVCFLESWVKHSALTASPFSFFLPRSSQFLTLGKNALSFRGGVCLGPLGTLPFSCSNSDSAITFSRVFLEGIR